MLTDVGSSGLLGFQVLTAVSLARDQACRQGALFIGREHLVLGLLGVQCAASDLILARLGATVAQVQASFDAWV